MRACGGGDGNMAAVGVEKDVESVVFGKRCFVGGLGTRGGVAVRMGDAWRGATCFTQVGISAGTIGGPG